MEVRVLLFGVLADRLGRREVVIELPSGATAAGLLSELSRRYPDLAGLWERVAVALDMAYVGKDCVLAAGHEVALIPPVSGG